MCNILPDLVLNVFTFNESKNVFKNCAGYRQTQFSGLDLKKWYHCIPSNYYQKLYQQPYHPAAQDRLPTEAKQGWAGQYLDGRAPGKTRLLLEEVLVRPAGGAHHVVCVGPNISV